MARLKHCTVLWSSQAQECYLCNLNLKGLSDTTSLNRYLERWIGDLASLILMDMILSTIHNPSSSEMATRDSLKSKNRRCYLQLQQFINVCNVYRKDWVFFTDQSSVYVFDTLLGLIQDILHYLCFLCWRGEIPQVGQESFAHSVSARLQNQQESVSGQATRQARQVSEKARKDTLETF